MVVLQTKPSENGNSTPGLRKDGAKIITLSDESTIEHSATTRMVRFEHRPSNYGNGNSSARILYFGKTADDKIVIAYFENGPLVTEKEILPEKYEELLRIKEPLECYKEALSLAMGLTKGSIMRKGDEFLAIEEIFRTAKLEMEIIEKAVKKIEEFSMELTKELHAFKVLEKAKLALDQSKYIA